MVARRRARSDAPYLVAKTLDFWNVTTDRSRDRVGDGIAGEERIQSFFEIMLGWRGPLLSEVNELIVNPAMIDQPLRGIEHRCFRSDGGLGEANERMFGIAHCTAGIF